MFGGFDRNGSAGLAVFVDDDRDRWMKLERIGILRDEESLHPHTTCAWPFGRSSHMSTCMRDVKTSRPV